MESPLRLTCLMARVRWETALTDLIVINMCHVITILTSLGGFDATFAMRSPSPNTQAYVLAEVALSQSRCLALIVVTVSNGLELLPHLRWFVLLEYTRTRKSSLQTCLPKEGYRRHQ